MTRELPTWPVQAGQILAGKYRVERILGHGGMGIVVAAHHLQLDEQVALKFLLPEAVENPMAVARFEREARAAAKIKSEHVARVTDVGQLENGAPFMVMEYLDGMDVAAYVASRGRLPLGETTDLVLQACEALAEAHVLGIVHRDLKPSNLFLANRPSGAPVIKVLDFGISKLIGAETSAQLTSTTMTVGSPMFMSPEQLLASKDATAQSDIWSLGVILYVLVTGVAPFDGESLPAIIASVMHKEPPPVRRYRPDVPEEFQRIVVACLSKDPAGRFADVGALAAALAPFGSESSAISLGRISHVVGRRLSSGSLPFLPTPALGAPPPPGVRSPATPPLGSASTAEASITGTPVSGDATARPGTRVLTWAALAVAALALVAVAILVPKGHGPAVTAAPPSVASSPSPSQAPPEPSAARPSEPIPAPPVTASAAAPSVPAVESAAAAVPAPSVATPRAGASPHAAHKAGSCNPPYTLDAEGHHLYKPECI